jgi:hypothetical protein
MAERDAEKHEARMQAEIRMLRRLVEALREENEVLLKELVLRDEWVTH